VFNEADFFLAEISTSSPVREKKAGKKNLSTNPASDQRVIRYTSSGARAMRGF
jgi:hypothetical protein